MKALKNTVGLFILFAISCTSTRQSEHALTGKWTLTDLKPSENHSNDTGAYFAAGIITMASPDVVEFRADSLFFDDAFKGTYQLNGNTLELNAHEKHQSIKSEFNIAHDTLVLKDFPEKDLQLTLKKTR